MIKQETRFAMWLIQMRRVVEFHEFIITVYTTKPGAVRPKNNVMGYDLNGHMLIPESFPVDFVGYCIAHLQAMMNDNNNKVYTIDFGELVPLYDKYGLFLDRKVKVANLLT